MIIKNWKEWFVRKIRIHENSARAHCCERVVWFAYLGTNIGFEQDGKGGQFLRPVVIIKKFNNEMLWVLPTTGQNRDGKYYYRFSYKENKYTTAIITQIRTIDSKRLKYQIGYATEFDFVEMKKRITAFLQ